MTQDLKFTRASSKGQIVIPTSVRKKLGIGKGSLLAVATTKDMIVLKKISANGLSADDLKTLKLIGEAWKDIEKGRYKVKSKEAFFEELRKW